MGPGKSRKSPGCLDSKRVGTLFWVPGFFSVQCLISDSDEPRGFITALEMHFFMAVEHV